MMSTEAQDWFAKQLDKLVERARDEWDLSYAEAIGCLFLAIRILADEAREDEETQ